MSLTLEINGTDYTAKWRPYESHWTRRAWKGESAGESVFILDDPDGTIDHADLAALKVLRVIEDASGAQYEMFKGRITTKTLGRGPFRTGAGMQWAITAADANFELRGIRVSDSHRPEESDRERVLAFRFGYLNGPSSTNAHARDSTTIDGAFVVNADLVTLPAEDYTDTYPDQVFLSILDISAKTFFVFTDGDGTDHLYYASHDDTTLVADISLSDLAGAADGVDVYAPNLVPSTGLHDGLQVITGAGVRYGDDEFYEDSDVAGGEADHDKFEEHFTDDFLVNVGSATSFVNNIVASRSNEDFTFTLSWEMTAENAHRMMAGYVTSIRVASANLPTAADQRATQVTHTPLYPDADGNARYRIDADFGLPRGRAFRRSVRRKPGLTPHGGVPDVEAEIGISFIGCISHENPSPLDDVTFSGMPTGSEPGDVAVIQACDDGDLVIPTIDGDWTAIGTGGVQIPALGVRGAYKVLTQDDIDGVNTWSFTDANSVLGGVYRGLDTSDPIGAIAGDSDNDTSLIVQPLTLEVTDGTSWVFVGSQHHSDASLSGKSVDNAVNRCSARSGEHGLWDTDGGVTSWVGDTLSVTSNSWQSQSFELKADQSPSGTTNDGPADEVGTPNGKFANFDHHHEDMVLFAFTIDNGASVLTTGLKWWSPPIPFAGTITAAYLDADVDGACVVDIGKGATWTGSHFSSICGGNKPTITATGGTDLTFTDTTLTGWTTDFAVNTRFSVNLDSVTNFKKLVIGLRCRKLV